MNKDAMTTADQVSAEALATEAADARAGNQALNDNPNPQSPAIEPGSSHQEPAQTEITSERKPYVSPRDAIIARLKAKREAEAPANDNADGPLLETDASGTFVPPFLKQQANEAGNPDDGETEGQSERSPFAMRRAALRKANKARPPTSRLRVSPRPTPSRSTATTSRKVARNWRSTPASIPTTPPSCPRPR
jgi:hypothetical protein